MICPRCDSQGRLYKAIILKYQKVLVICDECEATWFEDDNITSENFEDLTTLLNRFGLDYMTNELEDIGYI